MRLTVLRFASYADALGRAWLPVTDAFLIATALLVTGIGLYTIFIGRAERLPPWLAIESLDDSKDKLASMVVVALAVRFFTVALEWGGAGEILPFGLSIAVVILGLTAYNMLHRPRNGAAAGAHGAAAGRTPHARPAGSEPDPR